MLNESIKYLIKEHSLEENPKECCGLIYKNEIGFFAQKCKNTAKDPLNFFEISPIDYLNTSLKGKILAFYHSHSKNHSNDFTQFDIINAEKLKLSGVLYIIETDTFKEYSPTGYELPYIGRNYVLGKVDCFSLVKDYYKTEFNIEIEDITHKYRYIEHKPDHPDNNIYHDILPNHFLKNNFMEVKDLKENDVILIKTHKIMSPVHCAVYKNVDMILHHPFGLKSRIEKIRSSYKNCMTHFFRHKSLV